MYEAVNVRRIGLQQQEYFSALVLQAKRSKAQPYPSVHISTGQMAADGQADRNGDEESNEAYSSPLSLSYVDGKFSSQMKQRKSEGIADVQIWRWKSHNERVPDSIHTKETQIGQSISVCANETPRTMS
jgi:hypothetical protein